MGSEQPPAEPPRAQRLRRSELSVPGTSPKMLAKAAASSADLVFCDLEDSVAPAAKPTARAQIVEALNELDWGSTCRAIRMNSVRSEWAHDDLIDVVTGAGANLDLIIVPKVFNPFDVLFVDVLLTQLETKLRLEHRIGIEVLIEEAGALECVGELARCCPRVEALIMGGGDLSASLGMQLTDVGVGHPDYPGDIWHHARMQVCIAARAAGIEAVDGPYADFRDSEGYRTEADRASILGFTGKWAIHPAQIEDANAAFTPPSDAVAAARIVTEAYRRGRETDQGVVAVDGVMVDAASARIAQALCDRADLVEGIAPQAASNRGTTP